jgi:hypothetical protein
MVTPERSSSAGGDAIDRHWGARVPRSNRFAVAGPDLPGCDRDGAGGAAKDHLLELLRLRDPRDRSLGVKTLHVGMVEDVTASPERFFCASERMAVVPIPSLTSHEAFDCGIALGDDAALRLLDHGRQAYAAARKVETPRDIAGLDVLREGSRRP